MLIKIIIPVLAILGLGSFLIPMGQGEITKTNLTIEPVSITNPSSIKALGIIEPAGEIHSIHAPSPALIEEVFVTKGVFVNKNDALFRLKDIDLSEKLKSEERHIEWLVKEKGVYESEYRLAKESYDRVAPFEDGVVVSRDEVLRRKSALERAHQRLVSFKKEIEYKKGASEEIKRQIDHLTVRAGQSGQVTDLDVKAGEVARTIGVPHVRIASPDYVIRVEVSERDAWRVSPSQRAYMKVPGAEKEISAEHIYTELEMKPKTSTNGIQNVPDSRVLQVVYRIVEKAPVFIGQQVEVSIR